MLKDEKQEEKMTKVLFRTLLACQNEEDVKALLEDLCTYTEVEQMAHCTVDLFEPTPSAIVLTDGRKPCKS